MVGIGYRVGLGESEIVEVIGTLVTAEKEIQHLLCRYLADLADRIAAGPTGAELQGYVDVYQAAHCLFGIGTRKTRERVRIGRALRELPLVAEAFVVGDVGYSRVREVTRVATSENERYWLGLARGLSMRELEQRVAEAGNAEGGIASVPAKRPKSPQSSVGRPAMWWRCSSP